MAWDSGTEIRHPRTAWSATLSATNSNPTGWSRNDSGTYYQEIGKLVICHFNFYTSGSPTWGDGAFQISLPVLDRWQAQTYIKCGEASFLMDNNESMGSVIRYADWHRVLFADFDGWLYLWGHGSGYKWNSSYPSVPAVFSGWFFYEAD